MTPPPLNGALLFMSFVIRPSMHARLQPLQDGWNIPEPSEVSDQQDPAVQNTPEHGHQVCLKMYQVTRAFKSFGRGKRDADSESGSFMEFPWNWNNLGSKGTNHDMT